jgi:hypothetical protein
MAIDYSVYTVLQASRRSWRIGQTEPVRVYFFAYEETIQEDALQLVAAKVQQPSSQASWVTPSLIRATGPYDLPGTAYGIAIAVP